MKFYAAFSRNEGIEEGAILVVANTAKEAKKIAWQSGLCFNVDEYFDLSIRWLRNKENYEPLVKNTNVSHIVADPIYCKSCKIWGQGLDKFGNCGYCGEYPGDELVNLFNS